MFVIENKIKITIDICKTQYEDLVKGLAGWIVVNWQDLQLHD